MPTTTELKSLAKDLDNDHLSSVFAAATEITNIVSCRDKSESWRQLAGKFKDLLKADEIAFFLMQIDQNDHSESLQLKVVLPSKTAGTGPNLTPEQLRELERTLCGSNTDAWIAQFAPESDDKNHVALVVLSEIERKLFSENLDSTIWVLIKDRHENLLGALAGARLIPIGETLKRKPFADLEVNSSRCLSSAAAPVLELMRSLKILRDLRKKVHTSAGRDYIIRHSLSAAIHLLRADSGRVVTWGTDGNNSQVVCHNADKSGCVSQTKSEFQEGDIAHSMLKIPTDDNRLDGDETAKVRAQLEWGNHHGRIGVIEVNARPGHHFDLQDADLLQWAARHAASDCDLIEHTRDLDKWEAELFTKDVGEIAAELKGKILNDLKMEGVLIYLVIPRTTNLMSIDGYDPKEKDRNLKTRPKTYSENDKSAATWVYKNKRAFCCEDPNQDDCVNEDGRKEFGINGSLFAVPLGQPSEPVGSVVTWFQDKKLNDAERHPLRSKLVELVNHASNPLVLSLSKKRKADIQEEAAAILEQMMGESDRKKNLETVLKAIEAVGFRRVRLYEFRYGDSLVGMTSLGMDERSNRFGGSNPIVVPVMKNHYTGVMYQGVCEARRKNSEYKPKARLYPEYQDGEPIADSTAKQIGNPDRMPWAEVPIICAGNLYGLIAADKLKTQEWDQILEVDLDALDMLTQLAAQAFSMDERRGMLIQRHLRTLDTFVGPNVDLALVQRRLLLFLGHGEEGLGFSRAFYFAPSPAKRNSFIFENAVGSPSRSEHSDIIKAVRVMTLEQVLREANLSHDRDLNERLEGFEIQIDKLDVDFSKVEVVSYPIAEKQSGQSNPPSWVMQLTDRLNIDGVGNTEEILVAPLRLGTDILGLLVVDRVWDAFGLIQGDEETLESFSRHAAQVLSRHQTVQRRLKEIDRVIEVLIHESSKEMAGPSALLYDLQQYAKDTKDKALEGISCSLRSAFDGVGQQYDEMRDLFAREPISNPEYFSTLIRRIPEYLDGYVANKSTEHYRKQELGGFVPTGIWKVLAFFVNIFNSHQIDRESTDDRCKIVVRYFPEDKCADSPVKVEPLALRIVLRNLVDNAFEAVERWTESQTGVPEIRITTSIEMPPGTNLSIQVDNDGPELAPCDLQRLNDPISVFSTKKRGKKEGGLGLLISRFILRKFDGKLTLANRSALDPNSRGVRATITLPIFNGDL